MTRMLVDMSSLLWQSLLTGQSKEFGYKVEHDGRMIDVNGWQHGVECAVSHLVSVMNELSLTPVDTIFVIEGRLSKARRKAIYAGYKEGRDSRPAEAYAEFERCRDELVTLFKKLGATFAVNDGVEGDDVLAYLAKRLDGEIVILTRDGDMTTLIDDRIALYQNGALTRENKYGPFPCKYVPVFKALIGDGEEYKGAKGFGPKAFLDFLVWAGDAGLAALEGMMKRRTLHELEDDVAEFKPLRKIIDSAEHVYQSYECALLHDEWVNQPRQPMKIEVGTVVSPDEIDDPRLKPFATGAGKVKTDIMAKFAPAAEQGPVRDFTAPKNHAVFDIELIGKDNPVLLVCVKVIETGERASFWWHKEGDMARMEKHFQRNDLTWVSFNGIHFDAPIISGAIGGLTPKRLKQMADVIISEGGKSWQMPSMFDFTPIEFDHIDLIEVAPGVRVSLKTFAGRMAYPTMIDLPFEHDEDLNADQLEVLETYCQNDLGLTEALFKKLRQEVELRKQMSNEYGIDLRSKSDAQIAEAVLKKAAGITGRPQNPPPYVLYKAPKFIQTDSDVINDLIQQVENSRFTINAGNGQVEAPEFMKEPVQLGFGTYQVGVGGLHSTHDKKLFAAATDEVLISDFDVASYYPFTMVNAGIIPKVANGDKFIEAYKKILFERVDAKRRMQDIERELSGAVDETVRMQLQEEHSRLKSDVNTKKIVLNSAFGKLGSPYSPFYSPDLLLAVTLTGQLNLMCLIYELEFHPEVKVLSANTDGIMVQYPVRLRDKILSRISENAVRTGYEYEETPYSKVALANVNNYIAITASRDAAIIKPDGSTEVFKAKGGKAKRKGLFADAGLMKNPTFQVCSNMAADYLKDGTRPADSIGKYTKVEDFVSIRNVKGGGIQYDSVVEVDDWVCINDLGTKDNEWVRQAWLDAGLDKAPVKRKSRPAPVQVGVGGEKFGRIARWYMQKGGTMPINYVGSGNKVPKTDGARLCMTLPDGLPDDLDFDWYVNEAVSILADMGVEIQTI